MLEGVRVSLNPRGDGGDTSAGQFAVLELRRPGVRWGGSPPGPISRSCGSIAAARRSPLARLRACTGLLVFRPTTKKWPSPHRTKGSEHIRGLRPESRCFVAPNFCDTPAPDQCGPDGRRLAFASMENSFRNVFLDNPRWTHSPRAVDNPDRRRRRVPRIRCPGLARWFISCSPNGGQEGEPSCYWTFGENRPPMPWLEPKENYQLRSPEFSPDWEVRGLQFK
jgi:hypothetical protein